MGQSIEKSNVKYRYIRLADADGVRITVWANPKKFDIPFRNTIVEITGEIEKVPAAMGGVKMEWKTCIGIVTDLKVIGKRE